jgi:hypothetical protein
VAAASVIIIIINLTDESADACHPSRLVNMLLGPQNRDIDGAETNWAFFGQFP